MEATDLMIGDLVTFKACQNDENPVILKVWQLNRIKEAFVTINEAFVSVSENIALDEISIDEDIVGIPITPKILERNGFRQYEMYFVCQLDEDFKLWYYPHLGSLRYEYKGRTLVAKFPDAMNYVHQLQHALKMLGVNKEITL